MLKLFDKKKAPRSGYDPERMKPVIRRSICTGEETAGFLETGTGQFRDVMLIRRPSDLREFREQYGIAGEIETIY
ncbi:MAG: aspartate dehydrogenase [Clostridiales bacterium]|nr:aspartate dehydrogenase [Clostridiales bacterium]